MHATNATPSWIFLKFSSIGQAVKVAFASNFFVGGLESIIVDSASPRQVVAKRQGHRLRMLPDSVLMNLVFFKIDDV